MKGYFGGKEIIQVVLGGATLYKKSSEVEELPPPETLLVRSNTFQSGFIDPSVVPPTERITYNANSTTTDWVIVRPNSAYRIRTYLTNRCVVQLKNDEGVITTWTEDDGVYTAQNVVFNTGNNTLARVFFYFGTNTRQHKDLYLTEQRD